MWPDVITDARCQPLWLRGQKSLSPPPPDTSPYLKCKQIHSFFQIQPVVSDAKCSHCHFAGNEMGFVCIGFNGNDANVSTLPKKPIQQPRAVGVEKKLRKTWHFAYARVYQVILEMKNVKSSSQ